MGIQEYSFAYGLANRCLSGVDTAMAVLGASLEQESEQRVGLARFVVVLLITHYQHDIL